MISVSPSSLPIPTLDFERSSPSKPGPDVKGLTPENISTRSRSTWTSSTLQGSRPFSAQLSASRIDSTFDSQGRFYLPMDTSRAFMVGINTAFLQSTQYRQGYTSKDHGTLHSRCIISDISHGPKLPAGPLTRRIIRGGVGRYEDK